MPEEAYKELPNGIKYVRHTYYRRHFKERQSDSGIENQGAEKYRAAEWGLTHFSGYFTPTQERLVTLKLKLKPVLHC